MSADEGRYYLTEVPPETPDAGADPAPWTATTVVGKRLPRIDGYDRVSGSATYTADVILPGMLYGAILRCPHAHATVKRLDTAKAEQMPGVAAIMTPQSPGAEIPWCGARNGGAASSRSQTARVSSVRAPVSTRVQPSPSAKPQTLMWLSR